MTDPSSNYGFSFKTLVRNISWVIFAGFWLFVLWLIPTIVLVLTCFGIPFAMRTYRIAQFVLFPFNKKSKFQETNGTFDSYNIIWSILFGWLIYIVHRYSEGVFRLSGKLFSYQNDESGLVISNQEWKNFANSALKPFKFEGSPWAVSLRKRDLIVYYLGAYLFIAYLETILFTTLIGSWTFRDIILNFSMWGIIWLVSLFAYPMFFTDAQRSNIALSPYLSLMGYVIIIAIFYLTYRFHKKNTETRVGKKLSFNKLIDIYFPVRKDSAKKPADEKQPTEKSDEISESES